MGRGGTHYGIDIGNMGDPIYAMFDGVVRRITDHWDPNMPYDDYPSKNPTNATGNRVEYTAVVGGRTIYIQCWHMNDVSNLTVGQSISAGTLLGHVGQTGNATGFGSGGAHLHLQIKNGSAWGAYLNPHDYIYANYDRDGNGNLQGGEPNNPC